MIRRLFLLCLAVALPSVAFAQSGLGPISPRTSSGGGVTPATLNDATYCPDAGATDTYVCSMVSAPSSYAAGMLVTLSANTANTGTASVNVNSLGAKTIVRSDGSTLSTGDITASMPVSLEYDGTNFRMLSTPSFIGTAFYGASSNFGFGAVPTTARVTTDVAAATYRGVGTSVLSKNTLGSGGAPGWYLEDYTGGSGTGGLAGMTYYQGNVDFYNRATTGSMAGSDLIMRLTAAGTVLFYKPLVYASTAPAVSNTSANSCGTTAATIAGTAETGVITVGATSGTSCTLTFAVAATTRRQCIATNETSGLAVQSTYSSTTVSILAGTFAASDKLAYICQVY